LFDLEGIEGDWRGLGGIKPPTIQNIHQSPPIPSNPLVEGIKRTSPKSGRTSHTGRKSSKSSNVPARKNC